MTEVRVRVSVIGTGYVGFASALTFSARGFFTYCVDKVPGKIERINAGISPIYEPGADELLSKAISKGLIKGTTDPVRAVTETDITFICVGTPSDGSGRVDLGQIEAAARELGDVMRYHNKYHVFIVKSTVPPGTTAGVVGPIIEERSGKRTGKDFGLGMCPEFLKEGSAVKDSLYPDRLILGVSDERCERALRRLYRDFDCPKLVKDVTAAEMVKYCSNSFLATKISFANEFANLCEAMNVDVDDVFDGVGLDGRISPHFFRAGAGFGGSCFPKDVRGIIEAAKDRKVEMRILDAVMDVNECQYMRVIEKLERHGPVSGKTIAVLGLAFKPGTDDVRETRSLPIIRYLLEAGARVRAYDPEAAENFKEFGLKGEITYVPGWRDALRGADAVVISTEWPEFSEITERDMVELMTRPVVVDGRRIFVGREFGEVKYDTIGTPGK